MTAYRDAIIEAMTELGACEDAIFLGQAVCYPGTAMYETLAGVPDARKLEIPVAEEMQLGMSLGLALDGFLPISIYPRLNFLMLAVNQLVNHLDAMPLYGNGYCPRMIIRTAVPTDNPLDPGPQHLGDLHIGLRYMLRTVRVVELTEAKHVLPAYREAVDAAYSTIIVERAELFL